MGRNALYGAFSGGPTPSNDMHIISEGNGAHTAGHSTADDPMYMNISEVHSAQTPQSMEEIQRHNSPMLTTSHIYDYIPLDSAGNINWPPATSNISGTDTSAGGVTNTPSIAEV